MSNVNVVLVQSPSHSCLGPVLGLVWPGPCTALCQDAFCADQAGRFLPPELALSDLDNYGDVSRSFARQAVEL